MKKSDQDLISCPKCGGTLLYQEEWQQALQNYDVTSHSFYDITLAIYENKIPKYICRDCKVEILVIN
ncbi:hypothetical protein [Gracilibacillus phocaeensis]|uniref:hypothetical protein n=1 Tax=Gracilibacillus phocaeensis TaxID=2042304 RepID=UPI0010324D26|nr:hypothetical protein [Gracilibacillus phocaeensis]